MARIHAGLWTDCKNCNPDWKPKKRDRKDTRPKYMGGEVSVEIAIRRQIAFDLGEEEPNKDEKFALLQKYGAAAARIDRKVTKPKWQEEGVWLNKKAQYDKTVKGLVPRQQVSSQTGNRTPQYTQFPGRAWNSHKNNPRNSSRQSRPNYNPTRTGTPRT